LNWQVAVAIILATAPSARVAAESVVAPPRSWLEQIRDGVHATIDAAIIAKPPKLVPPKPVKLGTKLAKLGTVDIGGSLSALAAADLDGNGTAELYAVTPTEVVALALDGKPRIVGRAAFSGDRAPSPRDVVASIAVEPGAVSAAVTGWQKGLRVSWQGTTFVGTVALDAGFPQCAGTVATLVSGRNYYTDTATPGHYGIRCSTGMVDRDGYPLRTTAKLSLQNKLDIEVERCAAIGLGCKATSRVEHTFVGTAFEIADLDRDGKPELVSAGAVAPNEPDVLRILTLGADEKKPALKKGVSGGGIAGIVYADIDGNGSAELVVAVRVIGTPKVDLWRLQ